MEEKNQLSILLASSYPFIEEPGGVKDFILGLKEALERHGCKVSVVAPGSEDAQKKGLVDFVLGMGIKITTDQTEFRASLSRKKTASRILQKIKQDIIIIHEPFVPLLGHAIISSIIRTKDCAHPIIIGQFHARREGLNWQLKTVEFVARHLIRRPRLDGKKALSLSSGFVSTINNNLDGRIAVSKATKNFWQKKLPSDYKVIYNGIDTDKLSPISPASSAWGGLHGIKIILFAGRHDCRKGIDDLINAFNFLRSSGCDDLKLKITGEGKMTRSLQKLAEKLKLKELVEFIGFLPYEKLVEAYQTADLAVAPSVGGEGFNRTIIEARSCGLLVVCTDIEGHREAIGKDLFPFMAKPKNPHSLAKQIKTVLNLPETEKQRIRKQGREDVKSRFDWDIIAKEHLAYYKSLITKSALQGLSLRS